MYIGSKVMAPSKTLMVIATIANIIEEKNEVRQKRRQEKKAKTGQLDDTAVALYATSHPRGDAGERMSGVVELLEQILLHLDFLSLAPCLPVSKHFHAVTRGSSALRARLWLTHSGILAHSNAK